MITEDYVSFEVAKLLQEKGFNGEWHKHYWGYLTGKEFLTEGSFSPEYDCPAPTLQMAMKWLREVHGIIITIDFDEYELTSENKKVGYGYNIQKVETPTKYFTISTMVYDTYEEATEAAIKYCLENLI